MEVRLSIMEVRNGRGGQQSTLGTGGLTMPKIDIKPCPFCGSDDQGRVHIRRMGKGGYRVVCSACGSMGPHVTVKAWHDNRFIAQTQAAQLWNRRTFL